MIIFGWRSGGDVEWYGILQCEQCGEWGFHQGIRVKRTFTLFFIPILPLWSDTKVFCTICGNDRKVGPQEYQQLATKAVFYRRLAVLAREDPAKFEATMLELRQDASLAESSTARIPEVTMPREAGHACKSCGLTSDSHYKYCIHCGSPVTEA